MSRASTMSTTAAATAFGGSGGGGGNDDPPPEYGRPSAARRKFLRDSDEGSGTIPTVSSFFPLEKYFDASDKLLASFEDAFSRRDLDDAFVYGMRYSTFCVEQLVKHDYYKAKKFAQRKAATNRQVLAVVGKLEKIADWMDEEELEKARVREAKRKEAEARRFAEFQRRIEDQKLSAPGSGSASATSVEESAFAKLQRLSVNNNGVTKNSVDAPSSAEMLPVPMDPPSGLLESSDSLPPPMLPPPQDDEGPPSYEALEGKRLAYFGPGSASQDDQSINAPLPSYDQLVKSGKAKPPAKPRPKSIRALKDQAAKNYVKYQQKGLIQVSGLGTHQGRYSASTNGCTVISALSAAQHLERHGGVTDQDINRIIDKDCGPLLREIRSKLGLHGSSLIIPSDVHDHLVDRKILFQHKFVGAAGGNIIDPEHIGSLIEMLRGDEKSKTCHLKASATLFFHEHVVSIVKFPTSPTEAVYDLIDSMPNLRTSSGQGVGTRTRCHSLEMLQELLTWYATSKFSTSNLKYIEQHPKWDDMMADFDPRVFQAFVWADLPQPKQ